MAEFANAWRPPGETVGSSGQEMSDLRRFHELARSLLMCRHGSRTVRPPHKGNKTMTFANVHTAAFSVFAAVVTSLVFVSAAIGPVAQIV
jgi:hypothetical protein